MEDYCKSCKHDEDIGFCDKCYYNHILEEKGIPPTEYEAKPKPITNADKIRAMSDEELAEWICDQIIDRNIGIPSETWLDWLRREVET